MAIKSSLIYPALKWWFPIVFVCFTNWYPIHRSTYQFNSHFRWKSHEAYLSGLNFREYFHNMWLHSILEFSLTIDVTRYPIDIP